MITDILANCQRPLILLGAGAREAAPQIIAFAERWQIPMQTTWNAIDLVPFEHPLFVGRPGITATRAANRAIQECDFLLSIGARLSLCTVAYEYGKFAPNAYKVLVDIDPAEAQKITGLNEFICQDASEFIQDLRRADIYRPTLDWDPENRPGFDWHPDKQTYLEGITTTYQLCDALSDQMNANDVLVIGTSTFAVNVFGATFRNKPGQRVILSSCGLGSMGSAIPVAVGVALASGRRVVCIEGDGSFCQNTQELEVVRRLNLPITFFVMNNHGYASIRNSEMRAFGRSGSGETIPDIRKIAEAFGLHYIHGLIGAVTTHEISPTVVEVVCPPNEVLAPRVVVVGGRGDMGDMWPFAIDKHPESEPE